MFRFAIKAGLATTAVYYLNEEGIWRESNEALKVYKKLTDTLAPYVDQAKKQIPIELPTIPNNTERFSYVAANYWNLGVSSTFQFLTELPHRSNELLQSGIDSLQENPEIRKLFEAEPAAKSSSQPEATATAKK